MVDAHWANPAVALQVKSSRGYARDPLHPIEIIAFRRLLLLQVQFEEWNGGKLDVHGLSDAIHQFHNGVARDLYVTYTRLEPRVAVAQAVARKILRDDEVPPGLREALQSLITFYEESKV